MADTCLTCKFFLLNTRDIVPEVDPPDFAMLGYCRRYPMVITDGSQCMKTMWCGEWVAIP
jgi:hypothetical protein